MQPALADAVHDSPALPSGVPPRIGRFLIREEIGRGSNGVVYSATDPVLGRDVAIKAIPLDPRNPAQRTVEAGFLQEAKIAAGLNHPSIVTVFDAGKTETIAYIAMERLHGSDLHHWLNVNRLMSAESAAALIARVADAVHFAHRRGLIHRDIKPSNIFLGRDLKPKVLDFGIALAQGNQGNPDEPPKLIGTPNYMSPEQALGRPLDARSDIFSIGAILYEVITGQRAFDGANVDEILTKVVKVDPPSLTHWRPDASPLIGEIVFRALAKNPDNRYQTAAQLRNDLAAFAGRPFAPGTTPPAEQAPALAATPSGPTPQRAGRGALVATGLALVGLGLCFAFWSWSHRSESDTAAAPAAAPASAAPGAVASPAANSSANTAANPPPVTPAPDAHAVPAGEAGSTAAETAPQAAGGAPSTSTATGKSTRGSKVARKAPATPAQPPPPPPPEPGTLSLAIAPWGQVYLDGNDIGVAPPLNHISVSAGPHEIEVRNGAAPVYHQQIEVEPGKTVVLQHRF